MTTESDNIVIDTTARIFRDLGDPRNLNQARDEQWREPLWLALQDAGLTRAWTPDTLNGGGASIADGFSIIRTAGSFAVAVPLAETLLASWLLAQAGIATPEGILTIAPSQMRDRIRVNADGTLSGKARAIPYAHDAAHLAVFAHRGEEICVALISRGSCNIEPGTNVAGDVLDSIELDEVRPLAMNPAPNLGGGHHLMMGAAVRSVQMAGALQSILDISVAYANERVAFERPIGKFQAIQHNLARLAGEAAAAVAAASSAADAVASTATFDEGVLLEVASAKIRVGEAVATGAGIAHQVHGAIGFSQEHVLHRYTQRLWAWRDDFGSESDWAVRLGTFVARRGADALWPLLASR